MSLLDSLREYVVDIQRITGDSIRSIEVTPRVYSAYLRELANIYGNVSNVPTGTDGELLISLVNSKIRIKSSTSVQSHLSTIPPNTAYGRWAWASTAFPPPDSLSGAAIQNRIMNCTHQWVDIGVMNPKLVCKLCDADK